MYQPLAVFYHRARNPESIALSRVVLTMFLLPVLAALETESRPLYILPCLGATDLEQKKSLHTKGLQWRRKIRAAGTEQKLLWSRQEAAAWSWRLSGSGEGWALTGHSAG